MMAKKPQTIGKFLTKKYITTSLLLLFSYALITLLAQLFFFRNEQLITNICAKNIVQSDYQTIDTTTLEDIDGWLEILDSNNHVIFTKGVVLEKNNSYTQKQLLEMDAFQGVINQKIYRFGFLTLKVENEQKSYLATYAPFTGKDNKHYTAVTKFPENNIRGNINLNFTHVNSRSFLTTFKWLPLFLCLLLLIFVICVKRYSSSVKKHIIAPNNTLIDGFRSIKNGNYTEPIYLNADYEYIEIENSFNHMRKELAHAQDERVLYEVERQLLFANMAHDLRTPITTIKGTAQAVADGLIPEKNLPDSMATIISKTEHMNELINRLLIFSKLESADYELHLQPIDLSEMVRESLLEHLDLAENKQITVHLTLPDSPIFITGDATELRRVFDNLINNSIRHNPPFTDIQIKMAITDEHMVFDIQDNGESIPKEIQDKLFEPFVSGDSSRSSSNGSGLGLAISRKIIEKHQGNIQFIETQPQDKTFRITLPYK
ncbi:sensor histidine kinase [Vagococcus sp.]|uniref:sensor histidine kinase n=1 Tax=Vagococcus sp. TaxID=1933889 RepID=UPI002FC8BD7A